MDEVFELLDQLANSDKGKECIDNVCRIIARMHTTLQAQGVPEETIAAVLGGAFQLRGSSR